jgi:MFS transporter, YNFM family, putative membrane transport protein
MARRPALVPTALFIVGISAFANLYATQPLLPFFRKTFQASELLVSFTVSSAVLAIALAAPLIGSFADRLGRKRVIVSSIIGLSLTTTLAATAANLSQLIVWRFLQGCFVPGIVAVTMAYISEETRPRKVGATMATYVTGTIIGGFGGRFTAGVALARWDWHTAFLILGAVTFAGGLLSWWLLPRSTKFVRQGNIGIAFGSMRGHLRNPELLATYAVGFEVLFCLVGAFTYVSFYLADKPFNLGPAALASIFAVYLIGAMITPFAGPIIDRIGHRKALMAAVGMSAIGMSLTLIHSVVLVIAGLTLEASGVFICQATASSHVGKAALKAKSSASGLYVSFYYLGGFMGSVLPGIFWLRAGWPGCVAIILCVQCVTILVTHRFWHD